MESASKFILRCLVKMPKGHRLNPGITQIGPFGVLNFHY